MFVTCFLVELHRWSCFVTMGWGQRNIGSSQSRWQSRGTAWKFSAPSSGFWAVHPRVAEVLQGWAEASHREQELFCPFHICLHIPTLQGHHEVFPALGEPEGFLLQKVPHLGNFIQIWMSNAFREHDVKLWGKYTALSAPYPSVSLPVLCHSALRAPGIIRGTIPLSVPSLSAETHPCSMSIKISLTISSPAFPSPQSCTRSLWAAWSTAMLHLFTAALAQGSLPTFY